MKAGTDVFVQPRVTGLTSLVSHAAGAPTTTADAAPGRPVLAGDASRVAFVSSASNLAPGVTDANGFDDVFLKSREPPVNPGGRPPSRPSRRRPAGSTPSSDG